jgi:hypothetical protein
VNPPAKAWPFRAAIVGIGKVRKRKRRALRTLGKKSGVALARSRFRPVITGQRRNAA